jgi:beta-glucosidase
VVKVNKYNFPENFIWGSATAAFQIEGSPTADGKGKSIWDEFTKNPKNINDRTNANMACDHYNLYKEDVARMKSLNMNGYRFSISWPRILPDGTGSVNDKGLDFYDRLVDELLANGITAFPTLFHWDLPLKLEETGGFLNKDIAKHFADYAQVVVHRLGDRVKKWTTLNEPFSYIQHGYLSGIHAPKKVGFNNAITASHTLNLAHGLAYDSIKQVDSKLEVGITNIITPVHAHKDEDNEVLEYADDFFNKIFMDPIYFGKYPKYLEDHMNTYNKDYTIEDLNLIKGKNDFVGLNNYFRLFIKKKKDSDMPFEFFQSQDPNCEKTFMGWEVYPRGIYEAIKWTCDRYDNPLIYISENGASYDDKLVDGQVHDEKRIAFLEGYLKEIWNSIDEGCNVQGYLLWTLMDNFEWAGGLEKRFGIIYTDFKSQVRYDKDSGKWFSEVAKRNSLY